MFPIREILIRRVFYLKVNLLPWKLLWIWGTQSKDACRISVEETSVVPLRLKAEFSLKVWLLYTGLLINQQTRPDPSGLSEERALLGVYHLHCSVPWRLKMSWVYYMISAAFFKDWYSLPIGCWIKHEGCAAAWVLCVCVCVTMGGLLSGSVKHWGNRKRKGGCGDFLRHRCWRYRTTHDPQTPLIWHTSSLPHWVSGNFGFDPLFSYFLMLLFCFCVCKISSWKSKFCPKKNWSVLISGGDRNADLGRYRDVPDSQSTSSNSTMLNGRKILRSVYYSVLFTGKNLQCMEYINSFGIYLL